MRLATPRAEAIRYDAAAGAGFDVQIAEVRRWPRWRRGRGITGGISRHSRGANADLDTAVEQGQELATTSVTRSDLPSMNVRRYRAR